MRATLWIAASGFLLASGSAYAGTRLPIGHEDTVRADDLADASPARGDVTITDQDPQSFAPDVSKTQPAEASPQEKAGPRSYPVTVDPDHPGGLFPWGG
jgi:hypothetical protein